MNTNTTNDHPDYGMPIHPACELFPMMGADSLSALAGDIRINGLANAIVVHEGQIVDGRNRLLACRDAGVEPCFVEWRQAYMGQMPLARWIWSVNARRRHLTIDQIAVAEAALTAWEEEEAARQRQLGNLRQGNHRPASVPANPPERAQASSEAGPKRRAKDRSGEVRIRLAKKLGVSEWKARQVLAVQKDPELAKQVVHGAITLREANKRAKAAQIPDSPAPAAPALVRPARPRAQRIDRLARARLSFLESSRQFLRLIAWLGEISGDFDQAELLLANANNLIAAAVADMERMAVAADPLNAPRLGIKEAL